MRVHQFLTMTKVEGPGTRMCIWAQGCSRRCPGCFAKETWDKHAGREIPAAELIRRMEEVRPQIEGITLLGGEPFEQAQELALIAQAAQRMGLGVITFTGSTYEALLASQDAGVQALLAATDLLVDGEFRQAARETVRPLVGSQNQRFLFLTGRYSEAQILSLKNRFEVRIRPDGTAFINGMGDLEKLKTYDKERSQ